MEEGEGPPAKRSRTDGQLDFTSDDVYDNANAFSMERGFDRSSLDDVEKLKEFQVLDEVGPDDDSDVASDDSEEVPEDEIERMLDEDLPDKFKEPPKEKEKPYFTKNKLILEEKGTNHFEVLPVDWLVVMHNSGVPVYLHRGSRVCTLSKPYFLGTGSVRKHEIPVSAIPCLAYRKALEQEEKQNIINKKIAEQIQNGTQNAESPKAVCPLTDSNSNKTNKTDITNEIPTDAVANIIITNSDTISENNNAGDANIEDIANDDTSILDKNNGITTGNNEDSPEISNNKEIKNNEYKAEDDAVFKKPLPPGPKGAFNRKQSEERKEDETDNNNKQADENDKDVDIPDSMKPVVLPGGVVLPATRIETMQDNWKNQHLSHDQVTDYCKKLFKFKNVSIVHFKHWSDRRRYSRAKKAMQRPTLPEGTKLITIPAPPATDDQQVLGVLGRPKGGQREWIMSMNGRSYVSVFHEYVRRALQKQPVYEFRQLENAATPYEATVVIDGMRYGVGLGSSKRAAKSAAARESILILIPEMKDQIGKEEQATRISGGESDLEFFDMVGIEDPRIMGFCSTTMEPSPHAILRICLLRNFGTGDRHIQCEMKKLKREEIEFKMSVGKHTATVVCKNKKMGKQRASQAILQALHPHVKSWGSLLRLYGNRSVKSCRVRKMEEQEITLLQDKATVNQPNYAILEKLRTEMDELNQRDNARVSIGTLYVGDGLPNLSGSRLNSVDI